MIWLYELLFPVLWVGFLLYWQVKAAGAKATERLEPAASRIVRSVVFLCAIVLMSWPHIPVPWLYRPLLVGSRHHNRWTALRRLGPPTPGDQLEPLGHHQAGSPAHRHRPLCPRPPPHLHGHSDRFPRHRPRHRPDAGHRCLCPDRAGAVVQAAYGRAVDAHPIRRPVRGILPPHRRAGAVRPVKQGASTRRTLSTFLDVISSTRRRCYQCRRQYGSSARSIRLPGVATSGLPG